MAQNPEDPRLCTMIGHWQRALQSLRAYGTSSRLARSTASGALAIRSRSTMQQLLKMGAGFLRHAHRRFGVVRFADLRQRHGRSWVLAAASENTRAARLELLGFMERTMRQVLKLHLHLVPAMEVRRRPVGTGQWTADEQASIVAFLAGGEKGALATALHVGGRLGLRPSEMAAVTVGTCDVDAGILHVPPIKWRHGREVAVPEELLPALTHLVAGRTPEEPLFAGVTAAGLQRGIREARTALGLPPNPDTGKPRSVMAFRGAAATGIYEAAVVGGLTDAGARRKVAESLGHGHPVRYRIDISQRHYIARLMQRVERG